MDYQDIYDEISSLFSRLELEIKHFKEHPDSSDLDSQTENLLSALEHICSKVAYSYEEKAKLAATDPYDYDYSY